ncbi:MAG: cytochrome c3 family protein [Deltaproteobacteria bacterium]|nr:cytochrome c3 family protein [Deltaproteobacteria bacterium]
MRRTIVILAALGYFGASLLLVAGFGYLWHRTDPAPEQPIAFPHTVHAGNLRMPCTFCHVFAELSRHAGAPPVQKCMDCHRAIATDREEIRKLTRHYEEKRPIEWKRVYAVPDFIYFSHKRHLRAGLECSTCHGDVAGMKRVRRVSNLVMGWCVSCHRARKAPLDCPTCHK